MAFGRPALPAVLEGLNEEAGHVERLKFPAKSQLPVVLAGLGPEAMPGIYCVKRVAARSRPGVASLVLMKVDQAAAVLPAVRRLAGEDQPAEIRAAARGLLDKIEHK